MNTEPRIRLTAELYLPFTRLPPGDKDTQLMLDWTFDRRTIEELYVGLPPVDPRVDPVGMHDWVQRMERRDALVKAITENLAFGIVRAIPRLVGRG